MGLNQETVDLHIHTTASDGATSPDKLLDEAEAVGLVTLSLLTMRVLPEWMPSLVKQLSGD